MQASLAILDGEGGEGQPQRGSSGSTQRRNRPQVARLDYGTYVKDCKTRTWTNVSIGSMRGETSASVRQNLTAQSPQTPRRPGPGKRTPSAAAPHRGEIFSVDDDPEEVDTDLRLAKTQTKQERERDRE